MFQAFIENGKTLTEEQVRTLVKKEKKHMTKTLIVSIMKVLKNN